MNHIPFAVVALWLQYKLFYETCPYCIELGLAYFSEL